MADPRLAQESHKLTEQKTALLRSAVERRMTDPARKRLNPSRKI